jgi:hypothetical protein
MNPIDTLASMWEATATGTHLSAYVTQRDTSECKRRILAEGLPFLTNVLPKLGKALELSFKTGRFEPPAEFKVRKGKAYPMFLERAWAVLFREDGSALFPTATELFGATLGGVQEMSDAVLAIRQLTLMFYKLEMQYSNDVKNSVINRFIATDAALQESDKLLDNVDPLLTRAAKLIKRLLHRFDPMDIRPKHGSGASACKTKPWLRYNRPRYFKQVDAVYHYTEWYFTSLDHVSELYPDLFEDSEELVPTAKVVLVPKDSRGPRLISEEPRETMFLQQGLMSKLYEAIEYYPNVRAQLSCIDQTRNRALACLGSETGYYATLDLSDASDRVSWQLVQRLFPSNWVTALAATRSPQTRLPNGTIVPLQKFAPMGSACCFPVEAITFWALAHAANPPSERILRVLFDRDSPVDHLVGVAVFGDDIIVPCAVADKVTVALESVGLLVNRDKSYLQGPFRESCGGDFFLGEDVSIVRVRDLPLTRGTYRTVCGCKFRLSDAINNLIRRYGHRLTPTLSRLFTSLYGPVDILDMVLNPNPDGLCILGRANDVQKPACDSWHQIMVREVLVERTVDLNIHLTDRCQILRFFLSGSPERSIATVSLAKRHRYEMDWTPYR